MNNFLLKKTSSRLALSALVLLLATPAHAELIANSQGTVYDTATGLTWQKSDDNTTRTIPDSLSYAAGLNIDSLGCSWRLPNLTELQSIVNLSYYNPAIDPIFTGCNSDHFWSNTPDGASTNYRTINFLDGKTGNQQGTSLLYVRAVSDNCQQVIPYYCDSDGDLSYSATVSGTCTGVGCTPAGCVTTVGTDYCESDPNKIEPGQCGCGVPDTDTDGDGTADCVDACPLDPKKINPGLCGCGTPNTDSDSDGIPDCNDTCPNDPANDADADGICAGAGFTAPKTGGNDNCPTVANSTQTNTDGDSLGDACDACPLDPANDVDGDGICGNVDNCPTDANPSQADCDSDGLGNACDPSSPCSTDTDGDGVLDISDNCPEVANPTQTDTDSDGLGDACDACPNDANNDIDKDGVCGNVDNCPTTANATQTNSDGDSKGDACDICPLDANNDADGDGLCANLDNCPTVANPTQANADNDSLGDACDACPNDPNNDLDGDGICGNLDNCPAVANVTQTNTDGDSLGDACDACPLDPANDADGDSVCGNLDNCPTVSNAAQTDTDGDGAGDLCDVCPNHAGNDADHDGFCGDVDCNDSDPNIYPGKAESCDNLDNDCDTLVDENLTRPTTCGVGQCSGNTGTETCAAGVWGNNTCNPSAGAVAEICDGLDNDCDGTSDEGLTIDADGDSHSTPASCQGTRDDCNDSDPNIYPGKAEFCDNKDNDCDTLVDENLTRATTCGVGQCSGNTGTETCAAGVWGNNTCNPTAGAVAEICDGLDNDCDGTSDEGLTIDADGDGHSTPPSCAGTKDDCNDSNPNIYPGKAESCDNLDNDCDTLVDENLTRPTTCGVGKCAGNTGTETCAAGVWGNSTCDPLAGAVAEICDGLDNDCDGTNDDGLTIDADGDGHSTPASCQGTKDDCNDSDLNIYPGKAESCDNKDNDCDTLVDENLTRAATCGVGKCSGNTGTETCTAGVWGNSTCDPLAGAVAEICDGLDNDCDGTNDDGLTIDADGDGHSTPASCQGTRDDCNDSDPNIYPGKAESCDNIDNDCDGQIDENLTRPTTCGVGKCSGNTGIETCAAGVWGNNTCNPTAGALTEVCDRFDNDCDGQTDEGFDADSDGFADCVDSCPQDPANDADHDGVCGDVDACPEDPNKSATPGVCGCGAPDTEVCPGANVKVNKTPGISLTFQSVVVGGSVPVDSTINPAPPTNHRLVRGGIIDIGFTGNFSGTVNICLSYDEADVQYEEAHLKLFHRNGQWQDITTSVDQVNNKVCGVTSSFSPFAVSEPVDSDGDGFADPVDNCPSVANPAQTDTDSDAIGDACDTCPNDAANDADNDGICVGAGFSAPKTGGNDNCPNTANATQTDTDGDTKGDVCDACPNDPLNDVDRDGICGDVDGCPNDPANDVDNDGVCVGTGFNAPKTDDNDNCPTVANATQTDTDGDGLGNACDTCPNDPNNDADHDGVCGDLDACPNDPNKSANAGICGCGVADTDTDGDGTANCLDGCPNDPAKIAAGVCGCGVPDTDTDNDGTANCNDGCPNDPNKTVAGLCGCGVAETDTDHDNTPDCNDGCPNDQAKIAAGLCGCGVADTDSDHDTIPNCNDACPNDPMNDADHDGICGNVDNCPTVANATQTDTDHDGQGDACDICPNDAANDADGDGACADADQCPNDRNKINPGICGCGVADVDTDGDGAYDCNENCPYDPLKTFRGACGCGVRDTDSDGDGAANCVDAYPYDPNKFKSEYQVPVHHGWWQLFSVLSAFYFFRRRKGAKN